MKKTIKNCTLFLVTLVSTASLYAAPPASHNLFTSQSPSTTVGNWFIGCFLTSPNSSHVTFGIHYYRQTCYVNAPNNAGVDEFGVDFQLDATIHYAGQSPYGDDDDASASWVYSGATYREATSGTEYYSTSSGHLYYDHLSIYYNFWYEHAGLRTSVFTNTVNQSNRYGNM